MKCAVKKQMWNYNAFIKKGGIGESKYGKKTVFGTEGLKHRIV